MKSGLMTTIPARAQVEQATGEAGDRAHGNLPEVAGSCRPWLVMRGFRVASMAIGRRPPPISDRLPDRDLRRQGAQALRGVVVEQPAAVHERPAGAGARRGPRVVAVGARERPEVAGARERPVAEAGGVQRAQQSEAAEGPAP
jgi:hypothetical protein